MSQKLKRRVTEEDAGHKPLASTCVGTHRSTHLCMYLHTPTGTHTYKERKREMEMKREREREGEFTLESANPGVQVWQKVTGMGAAPLKFLCTCGSV